MNDKTLTNLDISNGYRDIKYTFVKCTILGKFAEWVVRQSPYDTPDITNALKAFDGYLNENVFTEDGPYGDVKTFTYDELQ